MNARRTLSLTAILAVAIMSLVACGQASLNQTASEGVLFENQPAIVEQAANWLVNQHQNEDGGYTSFSAGANMAASDIAGTVDALLALNAAKAISTVLIPESTNNPLDYLTTNVEAVTTFAENDGGQAGKLILALSAAKVNPHDFKGFDLVETLSAQLDETGAYGVTDPFKQSLAILALITAGESASESALNWLEMRQADNGSWDDGFGTLDNPDATAMALMALVAAGRTASDPTVIDALSFLHASQQPDGGWAYAPGFATSANSTALVAQALTALGEDWMDEEGSWSVEGQTPLAALLSFQSENGAFQADFGQGPVEDFFSTVQTIPALAGQWLPAESN
jgi:hypothetical protein